MKHISYFKVVYIVTFAIFLLSEGAHSQENETSLSRYKVVDEESGLPDMSEFQSMEDEARALHEEGNCQELLIRAVEISDAANKLANVIKQGLEPFYDASRDDQKLINSLLGEDFQDLIDAENTANSLLLIRNEFWVREAVCLLGSGQRDQGINKLFRALDYIDPRKQVGLWKEARESIWESVGYN